MKHEADIATAQILVVDDETDILDLLGEALESHGYQSTTVSNAEAALEIAKEQRFDLALCDLYMDGMDGLGFTRSISQMHPEVPVILITAWGDVEASRRALEAGASDFVTKPLEFSKLPLIVESNLQRKKIELRRFSEERADVLFKAIKALAAAIDAKSHYTGKHSARMADLCLDIGRALGLSQERLNTLELAAHVHDVGKIGIPDAVLTKRGKLTGDEWARILKHPAMGAEFLTGIEELSEVASIVRHHHERVDGSGYPDGLKGEAIPFLARILSVADSFEAVTSDRPYRAAISCETALRELHAEAGKQFDPAVVAAADRVLTQTVDEEVEKRAA